MVNIPGVFENRGPVPSRNAIITLLAEESSVPGVLVTVGSANRSVKRCDAGEYPIGWSQAAMENGKEASISLLDDMWKVDVDAGSAVIAYGDILAPAADGKVTKASGSTPGVVAGIALSDEIPGRQVLMVPMVSVPDPITT